MAAAVACGLLVVALMLAQGGAADVAPVVGALLGGAVAWGITRDAPRGRLALAASAAAAVLVVAWLVALALALVTLDGTLETF